MPEGNVGGGTGMICYEFKGGIGTSSRRFSQRGRTYTVGVLVQANHGLREQLLVAGVPVGREFTEGAIRKKEAGSIIIVVATDAPLLPHQLKRIARRAPWAWHEPAALPATARAICSSHSRLRKPSEQATSGYARVEMLSNDDISVHFDATVQATEEAIINALIAAETMTGIDGHRVAAPAPRAHSRTY